MRYETASLACWFFAALVLLAGIRLQPAFDCAKAGTGGGEGDLCRPALKRLDDELAAAYAAVRASSAEAEQKMLAQSQKRWIARARGMQQLTGMRPPA